MPAGPNRGKKPKFAADPDHRYLPRWEVNSPTLLRFESEAHGQKCVTKDLNCTGAGIMLSAPLADTSRRLKLTIYLTDDMPVHLEGSVCWVDPGDRRSIGVNFEEVDQKTQDLILRHAFELKKEDLVDHWFEGWDGEAQPPG